MKEELSFDQAVDAEIARWRNYYVDHFYERNQESCRFASGVVKGLCIARDLRERTHPRTDGHNVEEGPEVPLMTAHRILKNIYRDRGTGQKTAEGVYDAIRFIETWRREL